MLIKYLPLQPTYICGHNPTVNEVIPYSKIVGGSIYIYKDMTGCEECDKTLIKALEEIINLDKQPL